MHLALCHAWTAVIVLPKGRKVKNGRYVVIKKIKKSTGINYNLLSGYHIARVNENTDGNGVVVQLFIASQKGPV